MQRVQVQADLIASDSEPAERKVDTGICWAEYSSRKEEKLLQS